MGPRGGSAPKKNQKFLVVRIFLVEDYYLNHLRQTPQNIVTLYCRATASTSNGCSLTLRATARVAAAAVTLGRNALPQGVRCCVIITAKTEGTGMFCFHFIQMMVLKYIPITSENCTKRTVMLFSLNILNIFI